MSFVEERTSATKAAGDPPGLFVSELRVAYQRDIEILRGVELNAAGGEITVVIGPNGAGKSTCLKAIGGLAPITGGTIRLANQPVTGWAPRRLLGLGMAFVPQEGTLFRDMTVRENLVMGGWLRRREKDWLAGRVGEIAETFQMSAEFLARRAGDLSGGQQKLLEIARGIMLSPSVLLLDEPTAGLSPKMMDQVYERIRKLSSEDRLTVVLVDQNVRQALAIADMVYVLAMGRNNASGPAEEIESRLEEIIAGWMKDGASGVARV